MKIEVSEEAGVRFLHFGSQWIQGAMRVARPWALELEYTREMMFPLVFQPDGTWPRRALLVGLGAASMTKFLHRHRPQTRLTVVEIEPRVVAAARQFFKLPDECERLTIALADGEEYVARDGPHFDWIVVDAFDARGRAGSLEGLAFYERCRQRLARHGFLCVNLLARSRGIGATLACLREAFEGRVLALPPSGSGNVVVMAAVGRTLDADAAELHAGVERLRSTTGLNLSATLKRWVQTREGAVGMAL